MVWRSNGNQMVKRIVKYLLHNLITVRGIMYIYITKISAILTLGIYPRRFLPMIIRERSGMFDIVVYTEEKTLRQPRNMGRDRASNN